MTLQSAFPYVLSFLAGAVALYFTLPFVARVKAAYAAFKA